MTAFSTEEHGMLRGIWGELETMNRSLTLLVEILERQEQREVSRDDEAARTARRIAKAWEDGRCLTCGVTREYAGGGLLRDRAYPKRPEDLGGSQLAGG